MKLPALLAGLAGCWLLTGCQHGPPLSKEQELRYSELLRSGKVRTEFDPGASLTPGQQIEVVALAERCGIRDPAKLGASINPVTHALEISVTSRNRIEGRNRSFDSVWMFKLDWRDDSGISTGKQLGQFWPAGAGPSTTMLRSYEFRGRPIEVQIFGGLSMDLADEIFSKIEHRKIRFEPGGLTDRDYFERSLSRLDHRRSISIGSKDGEHQIWIGNSVSGDRFIFRLEGPDIVVTSQLHTFL